MEEPAGEKKTLYFPYFLALTTLFCFTPNLFALPFLPADEKHDPGERYAYFHHEPALQPLSEPVESKQQQSLRLDVTGATLSCKEDDCNHHRGCSLEIAYRLSSKVKQEIDVGTQVICQAQIDYTTSHGYHLKSERCSSPAPHILQHNDRVDSTLVLEFQFSPYEQVVDTEVGAIQCRLEKTKIILGSAK